MLRLSLIIATYNRAACLVETLRSVAEQDAPRDEWECVVVNNNSADDTSEIGRASCRERVCQYV